MPLNIKNADVERLADEVAQLAGETKTEAVRRSLLERKQRLAVRMDPATRGARARRFLEREVWSTIPPEEIGRRLSTTEEDSILGYGPDGA